MSEETTEQIDKATDHSTDDEFKNITWKNSGEETAVETSKGGESAAEETTDDEVNNEPEGSAGPKGEGDSATVTEEESEKSEGEESIANAKGEDAKNEEGKEEFFTPEEVNGLVTQLTGHKSPQDLKAELEDLRKKVGESNNEGLSPYLQKLIDYEKKGGDPAKLAQTQSLDIDNMADKDVLLQEFMLDNPELSKKKAELIFNKNFDQRFHMDEDTDEDEKEVIQAELEYEALKAKKKLKESVEGMLKIPEPEKQTEEQEDPENERIYAEHLDKVESIKKDFKPIAFDVDGEDKNKFSYELSPENVEKVSEMLKTPIGDVNNPEQFKKSILYNIIGDEQDSTKIDYEKAQRNLSFLVDPEGYNKKLYQHGFAKGKEAVITEKVNPLTPENTDNIGGTGQLSEEEEIGLAAQRARSQKYG